MTFWKQSYASASGAGGGSGWSQPKEGQLKKCDACPESSCLMTSQGRCLIKARKCFGIGAEFCLTLGVHPKTWVQLGCYKTSGALRRALKLAVSTVDYQSVTPEMFAVTAEVAAFIITAHHVPPSSSTSCRERRRSSPWCKIGTIAIGRTAAPLSCITTDSVLVHQHCLANGVWQGQRSA